MAKSGNNALEDEVCVCPEADIEGLRSELDVQNSQRNNSWEVISERINDHIDTAVSRAVSSPGVTSTTLRYSGART